MEQINMLEIDKSALSQKMLQNEKNLKSEFLVRLTNEKSSLEDELRTEHAMEMEKMQRNLKLEHASEMDKVIQNMATARQSELEKQNDIHNEALQQESLKIQDKETKIKELEDSLFEYIEKMKEMEKTHLRNISNVKDTMSMQFNQEKKRIQTEFQTKETQLKVSSTIANANLEKKYTAQIQDIEQLHKKTLDEIKGAHVIATSAVRKTCEEQKFKELTQLRMDHKESMAMAKSEHENQMEQILSDAKQDKEHVLNELEMNFKSELLVKEELITRFIQENQILTVSESELQKQSELYKEQSIRFENAYNQMNDQMNQIKYSLF